MHRHKDEGIICQVRLAVHFSLLGNRKDFISKSLYEAFLEVFCIFSLF